MSEVPDHNSFERCPHDSDNPYTQILNTLLRDENLSPGCRWMLMYLLSHKPGWKISAKQIMNHVKEFHGRSKVYDWIEEAIKAGYMKKVHILEKNLRRGFRYYISEKAKFKDENSNNSSDVPISGIPSTGIPKIDTHKKEHIEENYKQEHIVCSEPSLVAPPAPHEQSASCVKTHINGHQLNISKQDVYTQSVLMKRDWRALEIEEAWKILSDYKGPIRDWFRFIEGTISNLRNTQKSKVITKKTQGNKKCLQKKLNTQKESNTSEESKKPSTESDMSEQQWLSLLRQVGL